jgi:hypothetical protein
MPERFRNKGWAKGRNYDIEAILDHHDHLQGLQGRAIVLPEDPADPLMEERIKGIYKRLGAPDDPAAYEFDIPEGAPVNPNALDAFRAAAVDAGLNQKQVDLIYKRQLEAARLQNEHIKAEEARLEQEMIENWSRPVYEHKLGKALRVAEYFRIRERLEQTRLHRIAEVVEAFSDIDDLLQPEGIMPPDSPTGYTREGVTSELSQLKRSEAYMDRSHPEFQVTTAKVRQLEQIRAALGRSR